MALPDNLNATETAHLQKHARELFNALDELFADLPDDMADRQSALNAWDVLRRASPRSWWGAK